MPRAEALSRLMLSVYLRVLELEIARHILEALQFLQLGLQQRCISIQLADVRALEGILVLALGLNPADAYGRRVLQIGLDTGYCGQLGPADPG